MDGAAECRLPWRPARVPLQHVRAALHGGRKHATEVRGTPTILLNHEGSQTELLDHMVRYSRIRLGYFGRGSFK